ncbi:hypothetical protein LguiA_025315 [Lonicera macranthoides]
MGNSNGKFRGHSENNLQLEKGKTARNKNVKKGSGPVTQPVFPPEIIVEILSWLRLKYLPKMQLVCKQWYHIIQDRHFIEKQMSRALASDFMLFYNSTPQVADNRETFQLICTCDGLLLWKNNTTGKYQILNKTTQQILELPDPHTRSFAITFSFVRSTLNYKLVSIYPDEAETSNECCEVLTIAIDSSWRAIEMPNLRDIGKTRERVSVVSTGAVVHCFRVFKVGPDLFKEILSLDLGTESFTITSLSKIVYSDRENIWALDWYGKLAMAHMVKESLQVLVLEDYKKGRWAECGIVVPLAFMKEYEDVKADLAPVLVEGDSIWFWLREKKLFAYNFKTGISWYTIEAPDGHTTANKLFRQAPSLVKFKGMKPAQKIPDQQTDQPKVEGTLPPSVLLIIIRYSFLSHQFSSYSSMFFPFNNVI